MPNGGSDNCLNCAFNRAVQEMGMRPGPDQHEEFFRLSHCTLREVDITRPAWTYCANVTLGRHDLDEIPPVKAVGPVYASGLYEGYTRIPWHGKNEPDTGASCDDCAICSRSTERGIAIVDANETLRFCTNRHYVEWWNSQHEKTIDAESFQSPEELHGEA